LLDFSIWTKDTFLFCRIILATPKKSEMTSMQNLIIRKAVEHDAEQIVQHTKNVLEENPLVMGTSLEEFNDSVEDEKKWIQSHNENGLLLVAEKDELIIGMLNFRLSSHKKFSHNGFFGMSVQEQFTGMGIGTLLLNEMLHWAEADRRVEKIYLEVFANNKRALHLYTKLGFIEEGRKKNHVKNGTDDYVDELLMSKFVERSGTSDNQHFGS
jgi:RimJ/RimL family protein N-acetyltransferase